MTLKLFGLLICLGAGLCGCMRALPTTAFEGGAPALRPELFFAGTTSSSGVLETRFGAPARRLRVEGAGEALADGSLRLIQHVTFDQDAPTTRTWVMRRLDDHHYSATLTDAAGEVEGEAYGDVLHLRYRMKHPFGGVMEQWLYLQPDGRTVMNEATISLLGVTVARVSERITSPAPKTGLAPASGK